MASDTDQGERTEEATVQRREDFRRRGQVAQTRELSSVLILFTGVLLVWMCSRFFFQQIWEIFHHTMGDSMVEAVRFGNFKRAGFFVIERSAMILGPLLAAFWLIG